MDRFALVRLLTGLAALCLECYIEVKLKTMDGTIKVGSLDGWEVRPLSALSHDITRWTAQDHIKIKHGAKSSVPTAKGVLSTGA